MRKATLSNGYPMSNEYGALPRSSVRPSRTSLLPSSRQDNLNIPGVTYSSNNSNNSNISNNSNNSNIDNNPYNLYNSNSHTISSLYEPYIPKTPIVSNVSNVNITPSSTSTPYPYLENYENYENYENNENNENNENYENYENNEYNENHDTETPVPPHTSPITKKKSTSDSSKTLITDLPKYLPSLSSQNLVQLDKVSPNLLPCLLVHNHIVECPICVKLYMNKWYSSWYPWIVFVGMILLILWLWHQRCVHISLLHHLREMNKQLQIQLSMVRNKYTSHSHPPSQKK